MDVTLLRDFTLGELLDIVATKKDITSFEELWELADDMELRGDFLRKRLRRILSV